MKLFLYLLGFCLVLNDPLLAKELTIDRFVGSPSLSGPTIFGLKFAPNGDKVTYLKGKQENHNQQDLWAYDIAADKHSLLVDSERLSEGNEQLSEVEKARRERMRIQGGGIVEYYWSPVGDALLFPLAGDLYYLPLGGNLRRLTKTDEFETDIRFSPKGNYVSFVRTQNLYVIELESGIEQALTTGGGGDISYAMAEHIAQEQMGRMTGYWWSPDEHRIVFTRTDESAVNLVDRYGVASDRGVSVIPQRYPFAGTDNVLIQLGVKSISEPAEDPVWVNLGPDKDIYLARVNWLPDSETVAYQRQSRDQKQLDLVFSNMITGKTRTVLTESSDVWINLHSDLRFLKDGKRFIWASERTGYKHLYLMDYLGNVIAPITDGEWVVKKLVGVDELGGAIYFTGNADGILERHLYMAPLAGKPAQMQRLTKEAGWHNAEYGCTKEREQCTEALFIDRHSSAVEPTKVALRSADGSFITWMVENKLDDSHPYSPYLVDHVIHEFGTLKAEDGQLLQFQIMKPKGYEDAIRQKKKFPAIVFVYGGPRSQLVRNGWSGLGMSWFNQYLVRNGYVVFTIDNRGTYNRGIEFESVIKGRIGEAELADQVTGVEYLRSLDFVDKKRIGVWGWSFGGFMTLKSLAQAGDHFSVGVSIAPVTDWSRYDTHYTERYLGDPGKKEKYEHSGVLTHVDNIEGELLLVHGMADDNVFFEHSERLMSALQNQQTGFLMMAYPGKRHGLGGQNTRAHLWTMMFDFFEKELKQKTN